MLPQDITNCTEFKFLNSKRKTNKFFVSLKILIKHYSLELLVVKVEISNIHIVLFICQDW